MMNLTQAELKCGKKWSLSEKKSTKLNKTKWKKWLKKDEEERMKKKSDKKNANVEAEGYAMKRRYLYCREKKYYD